ncbi:MAG: type II secretion system protein GspJ [Fimbriimonadaceae bacterium]
MKRAGITLVELLIALAGTVILTTAVLDAYERAMEVGPALSASQKVLDQNALLKDKITDLLQHAYVLNNGVVIAATATAQRTYFTTNPQSTTSGLTQSSGGQGQAGASGAGTGTSELVFTVLGEPTSNAALQDPSNDFIQQNQIRGPEGGVVEYQIGLTPVGSAPDKKGVFIREQRPADTDPTQGGYEWLLAPDVDNLLFEFWDGTTWQQSWDTTTQTPVRLPAAVRVTYSTGSGTPTVFVVRLPLSDATPANPVTNIGNMMSGGAQ